MTPSSWVRAFLPPVALVQSLTCSVTARTLVAMGMPTRSFLGRIAMVLVVGATFISVALPSASASAKAGAQPHQFSTRVPGTNVCRPGATQMRSAFAGYGVPSSVTEERSVYVLVQNVGTTTCTLRGYPRVWFTSASGQELRFGVSHRSAPLFMNLLKTIAVGPRQEIYFKVGRQGCAAKTDPTKNGKWLHFMLPGSSRIVALRHGIGFCGKRDFPNMLYVDAVGLWHGQKL